MTQEQFKEILDSIGEDLYNKVVANKTGEWKNILRNKENAVAAAFVWRKSPEGDKFWIDVHLKFVKNYLESHRKN